MTAYEVFLTVSGFTLAAIAVSAIVGLVNGEGWESANRIWRPLLSVVLGAAIVAAPALGFLIANPGQANPFFLTVVCAALVEAASRFGILFLTFDSLFVFLSARRRRRAPAFWSLAVFFGMFAIALWLGARVQGQY